MFFVILLLHRQIRDDEACKEKYGSDWDRYCEKVPYRIIPYVVSSRSVTFGVVGSWESGLIIHVVFCVPVLSWSRERKIV